MMDDLIEYIVALLTEDESWQGNLTDEERTCLLNLARHRLRTVLQVEQTRLTNLFKEIGRCMSGEGSERAEIFQDVLVSMKQ